MGHIANIKLRLQLPLIVDLCTMHVDKVCLVVLIWQRKVFLALQALGCNTYDQHSIVSSCVLLLKLEGSKIKKITGIFPEGWSVRYHSASLFLPEMPACPSGGRVSSEITFTFFRSRRTMTNAKTMMARNTRTAPIKTPRRRPELPLFPELVPLSLPPVSD